MYHKLEQEYNKNNNMRIVQLATQSYDSSKFLFYSQRLFLERKVNFQQYQSFLRIEHDLQIQTYFATDHFDKLFSHKNRDLELSKECAEKVHIKLKLLSNL